MKIKKGFVKNNWPSMLITLLVAVIAITGKEILFAVLAGIFVLSVAMRYRKYDEVEQELDDWWKMMTKEEKQKLKEGEKKE